MKHMGIALKMARTRRGWTKKELSEISGIDVEVITEHEESSIFKDWKSFKKLYGILIPNKQIA
jgi:ribosome-binding protein aMBF1 (putative translation factor)